MKHQMIFRIWLVCLLTLTLAGCTGAMDRRVEYINRNMGLPYETRSAIEEGRLLVGMTMGQVRASIGDYPKVNRSTYAFGTREQWIYSCTDPECKRMYLYFMNGMLESWQEFER